MSYKAVCSYIGLKIQGLGLSIPSVGLVLAHFRTWITPYRAVLVRINSVTGCIIPGADMDRRRIGYLGY